MTKSIKNILVSARIQTKARLELIRARMSRRSVVMHHGLQRSGTNYLLLALLDSGVGVINYRDPTRQSPLHKHYRWQSEKSEVIAPISRLYRNDLTASTLQELDDHCGLCGVSPVHIVIRKEAKDWLKSMCNWGMRCGWFADPDEALNSLAMLRRDHANFHHFWARMAVQNPDRVLLVEFDSLLAKPELLARELQERSLARHPRVEAFQISEVPRSPLDRLEYVSAADIAKALVETDDQSVFNS